MVLLGADFNPAPDGRCHGVQLKGEREFDPTGQKTADLNQPLMWAAVREAARQRKVTVVNATEGSGLKGFPAVRLVDEVALVRAEG